MIKLYHMPLSLNSRRVWVALIEKGVDFELVEMVLSGDQFLPEFLAMNPFHHIPVLEDGELTVIESFAIIDYLDAKYPVPPLMPADPGAIATVRMVQMVTLNELFPEVDVLARHIMDFGDVTPEQIDKAKRQATVALKFFEAKLGDQSFFGGDHLSIADIVLGTVPFPTLGLPLDNYAGLKAWRDRLLARPAWQITQPSQEMVDDFRERIKQMMLNKPQGHGG